MATKATKKRTKKTRNANPAVSLSLHEWDVLTYSFDTIISMSKLFCQDRSREFTLEAIKSKLEHLVSEDTD